MSGVDCYESIKRYLEKFQVCVKDFNYSGAIEVSINFTRCSVVLDWEEGIYISEFFEWLFMNLKDLYDIFEMEDDDLKEVNEKILKLIKRLIEIIPIGDDKGKIIEIYNWMKIARAAVTKLQFKYWSEKRKRMKKGMRGIRIPSLEEM